jgi:flavodoxin
MKINIIYESHFGNGKKIIDELAKLLKSKKQDVKLFSVRSIVPDKLPEADLYIFSSPTRKFAVPPDMSIFLENFNPPAKYVRYALMTTYLDPRTIALKTMAAKLDKKGIKKAADDFKVRVVFLKGPVKENYLDRLAEFAEMLVKEPVKLE